MSFDPKSCHTAEHVVSRSGKSCVQFLNQDFKLTSLNLCSSSNCFSSASSKAWAAPETAQKHWPVSPVQWREGSKLGISVGEMTELGRGAGGGWGGGYEDQLAEQQVSSAADRFSDLSGYKHNNRHCNMNIKHQSQLFSCKLVQILEQKEPPCNDMSRKS